MQIHWNLTPICIVYLMQCTVSGTRKSRLSYDLNKLNVHLTRNIVFHLYSIYDTLYNYN